MRLPRPKLVPNCWTLLSATTCIVPREPNIWLWVNTAFLYDGLKLLQPPLSKQCNIRYIQTLIWILIKLYRMDFEANAFFMFPRQPVFPQSSYTVTLSIAITKCTVGWRREVTDQCGQTHTMNDIRTSCLFWFTRKAKTRIFPRYWSDQHSTTSSTTNQSTDTYSELNIASISEDLLVLVDAFPYW